MDRLSLKSTNAMIAGVTPAGKPPMSVASKRSVLSSKASESMKTVESVHNSPDKRLSIGLKGQSPKRPLVLEPIQNPPTVI